MPANPLPHSATGLIRQARAVAAQLQATQTRLVLAESCTAGLVAATIARIPGISAWFCGSAVVYREATKAAWLNVDPQVLLQQTAVSSAVARDMALGALAKTPEAQLAAAVTGHLGPQAPTALDGVVFLAIVRRQGTQTRVTRAERYQLAERTRWARQREATSLVLRELLAQLVGSHGDDPPPDSGPRTPLPRQDDCSRRQSAE